MQRVALIEKVKRVRLVEAVSGDLAARRLLIAAFLYYVQDDPLISDAEYDKLSRYVAKHWDELSEDRQWACGTPEDTRSSGGHFRFSTHCVGAALNYYKYKTGIMLRSYDNDEWRVRRDGMRYVKCDARKLRE